MKASELVPTDLDGPDGSAWLVDILQDHEQLITGMAHRAHPMVIERIVALEKAVKDLQAALGASGEAITGRGETETQAFKVLLGIVLPNHEVGISKDGEEYVITAARRGK